MLERQDGRPNERLDRNLPSTYSNGCHLHPGESKPLPCFKNKITGIPTIYIVGDSHAAQWIPGLEFGVLTEFLEFRFITKSSCPFVLLNLDLDCNLWISNVLQEISHNRPSLVVISNLTNGKYLNFYRDDAYANLWMSKFEPLIQEISKFTRILIIEDTPFSSFDTSECSISHSLQDCNFKFEQSLLTTSIRSYAMRNKLSYKSFNNQLCFNKICKAGDSAINYYRDENHISVSVSKRFGISLNKYIKKIIDN